jgi:hypothetical protein
LREEVKALRESYSTTALKGRLRLQSQGQQSQSSSDFGNSANYLSSQRLNDTNSSLDRSKSLSLSVLPELKPPRATESPSMKKSEVMIIAVEFLFLLSFLFVLDIVILLCSFLSLVYLWFQLVAIE